MAKVAKLTKNDLIRYQRQILYPGFGEEGQNKLKCSRVVVAGVGGLGSLASIYLACAGIGRITIVDYDLVELSNLNRQILYCDEDIGEKKVFSAARKLAKLNPLIEVIPVYDRITEDNAKGIIEGANAVVDGMDNLETRFILNSACVSEGIPFIHGAVHGLTGEITTIIPRKTACLACIFPEVPEKGGAPPVFGVTPALIASLQVMETIKLLANIAGLLTDKMLYVSGETMEFTHINISKRPDCRICGG
jgi:molybdopterin/thiamine biosynthesis adenylyltransferase